MSYMTNAIAHGIGNSAVSSNWYSRPDDQKFLSLFEMLQFKRRDAEQMTSRTVDTHKLRVVGSVDEENPSRGGLSIEYADENGREHFNLPTNWSFGQVASLVGAPASYLRQLPFLLVIS